MVATALLTHMGVRRDDIGSELRIEALIHPRDPIHHDRRQRAVGLEVAEQRVDVIAAERARGAVLQRGEAVAAVGEEVVDGDALGARRIDRPAVERQARRARGWPAGAFAVPAVREALRDLQDARRRLAAHCCSSTALICAPVSVSVTSWLRNGWTANTSA